MRLLDNPLHNNLNNILGIQLLTRRVRNSVDAADSRSKSLMLRRDDNRFDSTRVAECLRLFPVKAFRLNIYPDGYNKESSKWERSVSACGECRLISVNSRQQNA